MVEVDERDLDHAFRGVPEQAVSEAGNSSFGDPGSPARAEAVR